MLLTKSDFLHNPETSFFLNKKKLLLISKSEQKFNFGIKINESSNEEIKPATPQKSNSNTFLNI